MDVVDGEGCQWVLWGFFKELNPSLASKRLDVDLVLNHFSGQSRLVPSDIREGVHDLLNDARRGRDPHIFRYGEQDTPAIESCRLSPKDPRREDVEEDSGRGVALLEAVNEHMAAGGGRSYPSP